MILYVINDKIGKETAVLIESIEWEEKTNICKFITITGKKGKVETDYKKLKNNIAISSAVKNEYVYGEIIWEE
ncbi:MAG: hypothetical protein IJ424_07300 [Oscillospiraceae bacterium]|nr:hypothetical protein [Oscillospiraceae bacterium]